MNRKTVKIIAIVIVSVFIIGLFASFAYMFVFSAPASDEALDNIREEKKITLDEMNELDKEVLELNNKVTSLNKTITDSANAIGILDKKLEEASNLEKQYNQESGERIRTMCEKGMMSYLDIIFSSVSLTDFTDRIVIARELAEYDKNIIESVNSVKKSISDDKKQIEELLSNQKTAMENISSLKAELEKKQKARKEAYKQLEDDEKAYIAYIEQKALEEEELRKSQTSSEAVSVSDVPSDFFMWPTDSTDITSEFSPSRVNPVSGKILPHTGCDIGASSGAPIFAAASGTVKFAGTNGGYGNCVIIEHGNGINTLYAHMSSINTSEGANVVKGDLIGFVGSTGNSTGPHLHFEVILGGTCVNPEQFFD